MLPFQGMVLLPPSGAGEPPSAPPLEVPVVPPVVDPREPVEPPAVVPALEPALPLEPLPAWPVQLPEPPPLAEEVAPELEGDGLQAPTKARAHKTVDPRRMVGPF